MTAATESPLARLSEQELEKLAKELDAIHDEVFAELGDRDRHYIKTMISVQRQIVVAGRVRFGSVTARHPFGTAFKRMFG